MQKKKKKWGEKNERESLQQRSARLVQGCVQSAEVQFGWTKRCVEGDKDGRGTDAKGESENAS